MALKNKLRNLKSAEKDAEKVAKTSSGTIRYYEKFRKSKTSGPTSGARLVTEYNPTTGDVVLWNECYDHDGNVNRVHLKSLNGIDINAPHFPATLKEQLDQDFIPEVPIPYF